MQVQQAICKTTLHKDDAFQCLWLSNHCLLFIHGEFLCRREPMQGCRLRTGLCRIWVTLFFCSIILKSCLRSGDMFLPRRCSGSPSSTWSWWQSLELLLDRGRVRDPAVCLTSTRLMSSPQGLRLCLWKYRVKYHSSHHIRTVKATSVV